MGKHDVYRSLNVEFLGAGIREAIWNEERY